MVVNDANALESRRSKPLWLALCVILGAGLSLWSLYLVGLVFLFGISIAVALNQGSRRGARATLLALTAGYEAGLATLTGLYVFVWGEPGAGYLYLGVLAGVGLLIELPIMWWRDRQGDRGKRAHG